MKNNRRDFLKTAGLAGLSGFLLPVLAQQADDLDSKWKCAGQFEK